MDFDANYYTEPLRNGTLYIPTYKNGFATDKSQIPYDTEILQSFFELTNTTNYTIKTWGEGVDGFMKDGKKTQLCVAPWECFPFLSAYCPPAIRYQAFYIWTKEGFDIQIKSLIFKLILFPLFPYFEPSPQFPPQGSRITNLFGLFDGPSWTLIFLSYLAIFYTFKLLEYIADRMGYISLEEEIPFCPFR